MWTNDDQRYGRTKGRMPMLGRKKCHETPEPVSPPNLRACHSKCMARKYRLVLGHSFLKFYFCYFCFISHFLTLSLFSVVCCQALLLDKLAEYLPSMARGAAVCPCTLTHELHACCRCVMCTSVYGWTSVHALDVRLSRCISVCTLRITQGSLSYVDVKGK